jgi:hypothetical protein
VEAYFANKGILGAATTDMRFYWMGGTRQPNPSQLTSNIAAQKPWYLLTGEALSMFAPSNGEDEAPMFRPYTHWGPSAFKQGRIWGNTGGGAGSPGDCLLVHLYYG